jgi:hypothetical protein
MSSRLGCLRLFSIRNRGNLLCYLGENGMRMSAAFAISALIGLATAAAGQDAVPPVSCACEVSAQTGGSVASLEEIGGQVLLSGPNGYAPVGSGAELVVGDRIVLMNEGRAVVEAGAGCRVAFTAPALVSVVARENGACIAPDELAVTVEPAQAPPAAGRQGRLQPRGVARLSADGFFADLDAFLETRGVGESVPARNLDEILPVSP